VESGDWGAVKNRSMIVECLVLTILCCPATFNPSPAMHIPATPTRKNQNQSSAIHTVQQQSKQLPAVQLLPQEKGSQLQQAANNSSQVQQLKANAAIANNSPQVQQLKAYQAMAVNHSAVMQQQSDAPVIKKANTTGLPDHLKSGIEQLSGHSLDDVKVHYNSGKPAQLQAHAYAQGSDIHVAPGQEKHLPHEAWHVVQQKQGRVKPTLQMKGAIQVNDDAGLESEADVMGGKAMQLHSSVLNPVLTSHAVLQQKAWSQGIIQNSQVIQAVLWEDLKNGIINTAMVGEHHDEINPGKEVKDWSGVGVNVYYESDTITYKNKLGKNVKEAPDPAILRLGFLWNKFALPLIKLWRHYLSHGEINDEGLSFDNLQEVYLRLSGEIKALDIEDPLITELQVAIEEMNRFLPVSKTVMLNHQESMKKIIAQTQLSNLSILTNNIRQIHNLSTHKDTGFSADDTMAERSRQMILRMNKMASGLHKTIYKVGDEHIEEMRLMGIEPAAGLRVLNRNSYLPEYARLKQDKSTQALVGNQKVFDSIGNDKL
jgi:hypothetical protein